MQSGRHSRVTLGLSEATRDYAMDIVERCFIVTAMTSLFVLLGLALLPL